MTKFDNHKENVGSDGNMAFEVKVGDLVTLTCNNKAYWVHVRVKDTNMTSTNFLGEIELSDVLASGEDVANLAQGNEVSFSYDNVFDVAPAENE